MEERKIKIQKIFLDKNKNRDILVGMIVIQTTRKGTKKGQQMKKDTKTEKTEKNKPIYRDGTAYGLIMALLSRKAKVSKPDCIDEIKGKSFHGVKKTVTAAEADATVVLSPRETDSARGKLGNSLGNRSANGTAYFVKPIEVAKGETKMFSLHICTAAEIAERTSLEVKRLVQIKRSKTAKGNKKVAKVVKAKVVKVAKAPKAKVVKAETAVAPVAPVAPAAPAVEAPAAAVADAPKA